MGDSNVFFDFVSNWFRHGLPGFASSRVRQITYIRKGDVGNEKSMVHKISGNNTNPNKWKAWGDDGYAIIDEGFPTHATLFVNGKDVGIQHSLKQDNAVRGDVNSEELRRLYEEPASWFQCTHDGTVKQPPRCFDPDHPVGARFVHTESGRTVNLDVRLADLPDIGPVAMYEWNESWEWRVAPGQE